MSHQDEQNAEDPAGAEEAAQRHVHNPHDRFFHRVFSRRRYAAELVAIATAGDGRSRWTVDPERAAVSRRSYVEQKLRDNQSDLLVFAPLKPSAGGSGEAAPSAGQKDVQPAIDAEGAGPGTRGSETDMAVYILFEHKSSPSPATLMQLYRYLGLIWEDEDRDRAEGKTPRGTCSH